MGVLNHPAYANARLLPGVRQGSENPLDLYAVAAVNRRNAGWLSAL